MGRVWGNAANYALSKDKQKVGAALGLHGHDPVKCADALRAAARSWARFTTDGSGRDLFRTENHATIQAAAQASGATGNALGGAYIRVWNQLWDESEQAYWDRRAKAEVNVEECVP
jgi:hypothetical protein